MSVAAISSGQNHDFQLKNVEHSRRCIYGGAQIAYQSQYPQFLKREKELHRFLEHLAKRVVEMTKRHIVSQSQLLEENRLNISKYHRYSITLTQIKGLSSTLDQSLSAFDGLIPVMNEDPISLIKSDPDPEKLLPSSGENIKKGQTNILLLKTVVEGLHLQMSTKLDLLKPLVEAFRNIAQGKEMPSFGRSLSLGSQSEDALEDLEREQILTPRTPILEKYRLNAQKEHYPASDLLSDQLPASFFFPLLCSSSSTSSSSSSNPFPLDYRVSEELRYRSFIFDSMNDELIEQQALSTHELVPPKKGDQPPSVGISLRQAEVSFPSKLTGEMEVLEDRIKSLEDNNGLQRAIKIVEGFAFTSLLNDDEIPLPRAIASTDRGNSKPRGTPPKSTSSSAASSGRSSPLLFRDWHRNSASGTSDSQEFSLPSFTETSSRSCGLSWDWLRSCLGERMGQGLRVDVTRRSYLGIDKELSSNDGDS